MNQMCPKYPCLHLYTSRSGGAAGHMHWSERLPPPLHAKFRHTYTKHRPVICCTTGTLLLDCCAACLRPPTAYY